MLGFVTSNTLIKLLFVTEIVLFPIEFCCSFADFVKRAVKLCILICGSECIVQHCILDRHEGTQQVDQVCVRVCACVRVHVCVLGVCACSCVCVKRI